MIFAPHQDDETLGCGGTIILKRESKTPVSCVFMTDGGMSHDGIMNRDELRRLRQCEALEAAAVLGIPPDSIHFLGFPDGRLSCYHSACVELVSDLLRQRQPEEVYVPYRLDGTPDHEATFRIVTEAAASAEERMRILEYPIWIWNRWPWVPLEVDLSWKTLTEVRRVVESGFGLTLLQEFKTGVYVGNVIERKRVALSKHCSQMTVLKPGTSWPTLADVSEGEFLKCFFDDFEVFRCSSVAQQCSRTLRVQRDGATAR